MSFMKKIIIFSIFVFAFMFAHSVAAQTWTETVPVCTSEQELLTRERTVSASCPFFTQWLKRGDRDGQFSQYIQPEGTRELVTEVSLLQSWLNTHFNAGLVVDGIFGRFTQAGVKTYQRAYRQYILDPWAPAYGNEATGNFKNTSEWFANYLMGCVDQATDFDGDLPGTYKPFDAVSEEAPQLGTTHTGTRTVTEYACSGTSGSTFTRRRSGSSGGGGGSVTTTVGATQGVISTDFTNSTSNGVATALTNGNPAHFIVYEYSPNNTTWTLGDAGQQAYTGQTSDTFSNLVFANGGYVRTGISTDTGATFDYDTKQIPSPSVVVNTANLNAVTFTSSNTTPDSVSTKYSGVASDRYTVQFTINQGDFAGTYTLCSGTNTASDAIDTSTLPMAIQAFFTGTCGLVTIDFNNVVVADTNMTPVSAILGETTVHHVYTDATTLPSSITGAGTFPTVAPIMRSSINLSNGNAVALYNDDAVGAGTASVDAIGNDARGQFRSQVTRIFRDKIGGNELFRITGLGNQNVSAATFDFSSGVLSALTAVEQTAIQAAFSGPLFDVAPLVFNKQLIEAEYDTEAVAQNLTKIESAGFEWQIDTVFDSYGNTSNTVNDDVSIFVSPSRWNAPLQVTDVMTTPNGKIFAVTDPTTGADAGAVRLVYLDNNFQEIATETIVDGTGNGSAVNMSAIISLAADSAALVNGFPTIYFGIHHGTAGGAIEFWQVTKNAGAGWGTPTLIISVPTTSQDDGKFVIDPTLRPNGQPFFWSGTDGFGLNAQKLVAVYYDGTNWVSVDNNVSGLVPAGAAINVPRSPVVDSGGAIYIAGDDRKIVRGIQTSGSTSDPVDRSNFANYTFELLLGDTTTGSALGAGNVARFTNAYDVNIITENANGDPTLAIYEYGGQRKLLVAVPNAAITRPSAADWTVYQPFPSVQGTDAFENGTEPNVGVQSLIYRGIITLDATNFGTVDSFNHAFRRFTLNSFDNTTPNDINVLAPFDKIGTGVQTATTGLQEASSY